MTDEQINDAITEATGLWDHPYSSETKVMMDFCNDLNAMHEAEKVLLKEWQDGCVLWLEYTHKLMLACSAHLTEHATARQRAEAFLRTLGKWQATDKESLSVGATTEDSSVDQKEVQK